MRSVPVPRDSRLIAGFIAIIPLYVIGLLTSYLGSRFVVVYAYGQSAGTYDHYFTLFLPPVDILLSFLKVLAFAVIVILIHCYYGYTATGGPAGRRPRGRARGAADDRRRQHLRLLPLPRALGLDHDRPDRRMTRAPRTRCIGVVLPRRHRRAHRVVGDGLQQGLPVVHDRVAAHRCGRHRAAGRFGRQGARRPRRRGQRHHDQRRRRDRAHAARPGQGEVTAEERAGADPAQDLVRRAVRRSRAADGAEFRRTCSSGAKIPQDTSKASIEVQHLFEDLLPVLQAVQPEKLDATLGEIVGASARPRPDHRRDARRRSATTCSSSRRRFRN